MDGKVKRWLPLIVLVLCLAVPATSAVAGGPPVPEARTGEGLPQIAPRHGVTGGPMMHRNRPSDPDQRWWSWMSRVPARDLAQGPGQDAHVMPPVGRPAQIPAPDGLSVHAPQRAYEPRNLAIVHRRQPVQIRWGGWAPVESSGMHIVRRGDTLAKIACLYDTTVNSLVSLNGLRHGDFIRVGQRLLIG